MGKQGAAGHLAAEVHELQDGLAGHTRLATCTAVRQLLQAADIPLFMLRCNLAVICGKLENAFHSSTYTIEYLQAFHGIFGAGGSPSLWHQTTKPRLLAGLAHSCT